MKVTVLGASGYIGGELLRLLLGHPQVEVAQASSDRWAGRPLAAVHPNLQGLTDLAFCRHEEIVPCDALFVATPHGVARRLLPDWARLAPRVLDLSADFRLREASLYERYYGATHPHPEWLPRFVAGMPELYRARLRGAELVAVPGCTATAAVLALYPLAAAELLAGEVLVDARSGSSGSGARPTPAGHHAERSGALRVFRPTGHRHEAEVTQVVGVPARVTATAVEAVRGVQVVCQVSPPRAVTDGELWRAYRRCYADEPFVRLIKRASGLYRLPEPKILSGSNYCDVGFARSADGSRVVAIAALDNLVKGGAGNALQCLNIAAGFDERAGLEFPGLHPI